MLSDEQIIKFQTLYQKHFGRKINKDEACDKGIKLINLIQTICRPDDQQNQKENNYKNIQA